MARTKQTARRATRRAALPGSRFTKAMANGKKGHSEGPETDDDSEKRLKEIEEGDMRAELKHIDKKYTEQGTTYFVSIHRLQYGPGTCY
jgi:hypothetical protein